MNPGEIISAPKTQRGDFAAATPGVVCFRAMLRFAPVAVLTLALTLALGACGNTLVTLTNSTKERLGLELHLFDAKGQRRDQALSTFGVAAGDTVRRHFTVRPGVEFEIEAYTGTWVKVKTWTSPRSPAAQKPFRFVVHDEDLIQNSFYLRLGPR